LAGSLKKEVRVDNPQIIFDNFIALHIRLRYWLLILTMVFVVMNYTSRVLTLSEVHGIMDEDTIKKWRFVLFMCGTSQESPISIEFYLMVVGLTVIEIKCCGLLSKIGRPADVSK
jgi:hypothetical protein